MGARVENSSIRVVEPRPVERAAWRAGTVPNDRRRPRSLRTGASLVDTAVVQPVTSEMTPAAGHRDAHDAAQQADGRGLDQEE